MKCLWLVVIGYGLGPSNDQLRRVLDLSHPGTVRLVDWLAADGLVERRRGQDKRAIALHLTDKGHASREALLRGRLASINHLLMPLSVNEQDELAALLHKVLSSMGASELPTVVGFAAYATIGFAPIAQFRLTSRAEIESVTTALGNS